MDVLDNLGASEHQWKIMEKAIDLTKE